ncbi:uncharacterized protein LOC106711872 [Papilio machaon]|uniref:uncharacterized protein LOC106711872 n=1 Tax=Papilio machaon TaxID=76193 RepID=UPI001E665F8B|nr:uncharacterized protein LOC106711872 [Papilio machaon]
MEYTFWSRMFILCVIPIIVTSITISPNGNSPEIKMVGGERVDLQKGFVPSRIENEGSNVRKNLEKNKNLRINSTKLAINERYRRLIPYMTFYYANDLVVPTTEAYNKKNVEVEKAQIVEAGTLQSQMQHGPKMVYSTNRHHNIPRYQGNRLTHFNIASANPTKIFYSKDGYPIVVQNVPKLTSHYNPSILDHLVAEHDPRRYVAKEPKFSNVQYTSARKPYINVHHSEENAQYYFPERDDIKYKLVPYDQTPPIKNLPQIEYDNAPKKFYNIPSEDLNDSVYIKPRPRPQYHFDELKTEHGKNRKPPATISEVYYEKQNPLPISEPVIETGFKPIISQTTESANPLSYTQTLSATDLNHYDVEKPQELQIESGPAALEDNEKTQYEQYVVEQPTYKPQPETANAITLADLLNSLQLNKSIPKPITKENVGSSIRILLQALNDLKGKLQQSEVDPPVLSSPTPFVAPKPSVTTVKPVIQTTTSPAIEDTGLSEEAYLAEVENPSQHLDDYTSTSQRFPLPITSDEEGGTPGHPGIDYPILTVIPQTKFDCKTQRYKGFFADPETRCQVWHYCDLNGGQASFLCPNGTIFSQAALTCDWWFNVKCSSTAQLYVLNESLYKYILPHSPKFPEDYSGPLVDKYLTLKFKEMEEEFKKNKNKNKQGAEDKIDSNEDEDSKEDEKDVSASSDEKEDEIAKKQSNTVSESSVIVATSGASGNVQRLED